MKSYEERKTEISVKPTLIDSTDPDGCIKSVIVMDVQWSDCPEDVVKEVKQLWGDYDHGNDYYYQKFDVLESYEDYPLIAKYLESKGILECLIHWWW